MNQVFGEDKTTKNKVMKMILAMYDVFCQSDEIGNIKIRLFEKLIW
jgi:hypothetical protein